MNENTPNTTQVETPACPHAKGTLQWARWQAKVEGKCVKAANTSTWTFRDGNFTCYIPGYRQWFKWTEPCDIDKGAGPWSIVPNPLKVLTPAETSKLPARLLTIEEEMELGAEKLAAEIDDASDERFAALTVQAATLRAEIAQCKAEHAQETAFHIATEGFANKADAEHDASQALAERYREALERERDNHKRCIDRVQALNAQEDAIANSVHAACTELGLDVWNVGIPERVTMLCEVAQKSSARATEADGLESQLVTITNECNKAVVRALSAEKGWEDAVRLLDTTTSAAAVERDEALARVEALTDERDKAKAEYQRMKADLGDHALEAMRIARDRDAAIARAEKAEETERRWMQTGTEIDEKVAGLEHERDEVLAKAIAMEALADERRDQVVRQAEYIRVLKHEVDAVREVLTAERKRADAAEVEIASLQHAPKEVAHG